jgi:hypothetical protein
MYKNIQKGLDSSHIRLGISKVALSSYGSSLDKLLPLLVGLGLGKLGLSVQDLFMVLVMSITTRFIL